MSNQLDPKILELLTTLGVVFSGAPVDKAQIDVANVQLQDFQTTPAAWEVCEQILVYPTAASGAVTAIPDYARIFAAQTIRTKVIYDLNQLDVPQRNTLFSVLSTALTATYLTGPRVIVTQICLALAGLALQMEEGAVWMQNLLATLGGNVQTMASLLTFLTVLPEEITTNTRIPISDQDYMNREEELLVSNSSKVLELLNGYIALPAGTASSIHEQTFACLRSWINAGIILPIDLAKTPIFNAVFAALGSEEFFETAVDLICDIIHETQEIDENMDVIQLIVPQLVTLKTALTNFADDPDKIRGLCRILAEAGEAYRGLILHHPETFFPIVEGISICSAYHDLDIVLITFGFWYRLAQSLGKRSSTSPMFHDAYRNLVDVMVRHLHFPADGTSMTAQERDDFRAFRHRMGDTLKDCCYVLGTNNCLMFTYDLITGALSRAQTAGTPPAWQEIEAPLFSMRSMGAEVDLGDDEVMPRIMDLIPLLPTHPRIKYAAILVLSRYSEWIDRHPTYIPFTLSYISAGFEDPDEEVAAAAGQAMKYLCKDCKQHLGPYLENLYTFVHTVCPRLAQIERLQIFEAIAYVISSLPMEQAAQALRKFSFEVIEKIHVVLSKNAAATQNELQDIQDGLEQLEVMLAVVQTFGEVLPDACQNACPEAWIVFDALLIKYGSVYNVADRACRVLRLGIQFFGSSSLPVIPSLLDRMASCFESSGHSSYIWIVGKAVGHFGHEEDLAFRELFKNAYERISTKLLSMLQVQPPRGMPDVMEDYVHLLLQMVDFMPDVLFLSVAFPSAFNATLACLELPSDEIVFAALDLIRNIVGHDSIHPTESAKAPPPKFPLYAQAIRQAVEESGAFAVEHLMLGLVSTFSQDTTPLVVSILVTIARLWTKDISGWIVNAISKLPPSAVPAGVDATFINDFNLALSNADIDKVKAALHNINRSCRKLRDRRRDIDTGYD